jgi:hypothetical protein
MHIVHIVHILDKKSHYQGFHRFLPLLLGPHPTAQLITYHHWHLQPSPLFADLSQKAPGKSADSDSRRMAKGIVPVTPTGTRGMEDTEITYKTCACSRAITAFVNELESAIRYPGRPDKHHVLAIGLLQI